jgi:hypothetical protein
LLNIVAQKVTRNTSISSIKLISGERNKQQKRSAKKITRTIEEDIIAREILFLEEVLWTKTLLLENKKESA